MAAPATVAAISSKLHLRSSSPSLRSSRRQATPSFRCSASSDDGKATPLLLKLAVGGVTALLSFLSPRKSRGDPKDEAVTLAGSADDVVRILRSDYDRAYFLTGNFTPDIYTEDCLFEDPTISFRGISMKISLRENDEETDFFSFSYSIQARISIHRIWSCSFLSLTVHLSN